MAIGKSQENKKFTLLVGVATVEVVAINPDQKLLQKIIGREVNPPIYNRTQEYPDGEKEVADVVFWLKIKDSIAKERIIRLQYSLIKSTWVSKTTNKIQVMNSFGSSTWISQEDLKVKNTEAMPWFRPEGLRASCRGESALTETILKWFNILSPNKADNIEDAFCQIDNLKALFSGDFSELHKLVVLGEGKVFKVLCGVRDGNDGKVFQTVYNGMVLKGWEVDYNKLADSISNISGAYYGKYPFELQEYKVETDEPKVKEEKVSKEGDNFDDLPF